MVSWKVKLEESDRRLLEEIVEQLIALNNKIEKLNIMVENLSRK